MNGRIKEYYNEELLCLEHFRFKQLFLRGKKNAYITFIPKEMVNEIVNSEPITYEAIRKRLLKNGLRLRINELSDYFATFMVKHGLISFQSHGRLYTDRNFRQSCAFSKQNCRNYRKVQK